MRQLFRMAQQCLGASDFGSNFPRVISLKPLSAKMFETTCCRVLLADNRLVNAERQRLRRGDDDGVSATAIRVGQPRTGTAKMQTRPSGARRWRRYNPTPRKPKTAGT